MKTKKERFQTHHLDLTDIFDIISPFSPTSFQLFTVKNLKLPFLPRNKSQTKLSTMNATKHSETKGPDISFRGMWRLETEIKTK